MNTTRETPFTEAIASLYRLIGDMRPASLRTQAFEYVARVAAELERLREHSRLAEAVHLERGQRIDDLEDTVARLRDGLRRIVGPNPHYDPDGQHDYGWENEPPRAFAPQWVRDITNDLLVDRALLSASQDTKETA